MDILKKFFPFAFTEKADVAALVLYAILHVFALAVVGVVSALLAILFALIPFLSALFSLVLGLVELYIIISTVLCFLDYFKVLQIKS